MAQQPSIAKNHETVPMVISDAMREKLSGHFGHETILAAEQVGFEYGVSHPNLTNDQYRDAVMDGITGMEWGTALSATKVARDLAGLVRRHGYDYVLSIIEQLKED